MAESKAETGQKSPYGPGVLERGGKLYRTVTIEAADGTNRVQERQVAKMLDQAKALRIDFYHPEFGWFRDGYKWERDLPLHAILADGSQAEMASVERQEQLKEEAAHA